MKDILLRQPNNLVDKNNGLSQEFNVIVGKGKACATFGELLQGVLPTNRNFLVTFPIDMYSNAVFEPIDGLPLTVYPAYKTKSLKLVRLILEYFDFPLLGKLTIHSDIPVGKGMASSSADLVASAIATADAFGLNLKPALIEKFMAEIEPSDGVMYEGVVSYYQREALLRSYLGILPPLVILGIDEGGHIDTIEFSVKRNSFTISQKAEYSCLLQRLEQAVRIGDLLEIGKITTRSAIMHQQVKPNVSLDLMLEINERIDGVGIAIAHSGTLVGILLDVQRADYNSRLNLGMQLLIQQGLQPMIFNPVSKRRR